MNKAHEVYDKIVLCIKFKKYYIVFNYREPLEKVDKIRVRLR